MILGPIMDSIKGVQNALAPKIQVDATLSEAISNSGFNLFNLIFFLIGVVFFANLVLAAWDYIGSNGDTKKAGSAGTRILNGLIGVIVVFGSFILVRLVASFLGLNHLI